MVGEIDQFVLCVVAALCVLEHPARDGLALAAARLLPVMMPILVMGPPVRDASPKLVMRHRNPVSVTRQSIG
ncbi:hypothetical protein NKG05_15120 [Oerskovia sp. M15]